MEVLPIQDTDPEAVFDATTLLDNTGRTGAMRFKSFHPRLIRAITAITRSCTTQGLEPLRSDARFTNLVNRTSEMSQRARTVFLDTGGDRLLGLS
jgi:hypothetical protein